LDDGGDANLLGPAEKFMHQFGKVPNIAQRLQCFKFMVTFEPKKVDLHPDIVTLKKVSSFVKSDSRISKLLEIILHIGNFLNAGNSRLGAAFGFSLDTLSKLLDAKTIDNKSNVFEMIVVMIKDSPKATDAELLKFAKQELELLESGSRVSLQTVDGELKKLRKEFDTICGIAPGITAHPDEGTGAEDQFQNRWTKFKEKTSSELSELEADFKDMNTTYESTVLLFAEDPKMMGPEEFFAIWKNFIGKVVEVSEKIDAEREKADKAKKKRRSQEKEGRTARWRKRRRRRSGCRGRGR